MQGKRVITNDVSNLQTIQYKYFSAYIYIYITYNSERWERITWISISPSSSESSRSAASKLVEGGTSARTSDTLLSAYKTCLWCTTSWELIWNLAYDQSDLEKKHTAFVADSSSSYSRKGTLRWSVSGWDWENSETVECCEPKDSEKLFLVVTE